MFLKQHSKDEVDSIRDSGERYILLIKNWIDISKTTIIMNIEIKYTRRLLFSGCSCTHPTK